MCDMFGWTECSATSTCSCSLSLFGWVCLWCVCAIADMPALSVRCLRSLVACLRVQAGGSIAPCTVTFICGGVCRHDCCPLENGVTCEDLKHCCPASAPVCDMERQACVSEDGRASVPWTDKTKASVAANKT